MRNIRWTRLSGRAVALVCAAAALVVGTARSAGAADRAGQATSAAGVIAGVPDASGNAYTLTMTNTGREPIECMRFTVAQGVTLTGTTSPPGTQTGVLNGRQFGARIDPALQPGDSKVWTFTTQAPYPANAGGGLDVSPDCIEDVPGMVTGPAPGGAVAPPPPPPPGPRCKCVSLDVKVTREALNFSDPNRFHFQLVWTIKCEGAAGNCRGQIKVGPPPGFKITTQQKYTVHCVGGCKKKATSGAVFIGGKFPADFKSLPERRNKTVEFTFTTFCLQDGRYNRVGQQTLTVVYNSKGITDQRKTDFNATGVPDGRERH
jgi:hypothetical protein